ncbi:MAG: hypothetical protein HUU29_11410 [Planctomycetaceae bacterium]|nr:hypothetical protein [Planctomycetaceae bacterium]
MNLTERYVVLCKELASLGYQWTPRPGDWILDITDESIGMLTTYIEKPELIRKVNVQIPYGDQIKELLAKRGCLENVQGGNVIWLDSKGNEIYRCTAEANKLNDDEHSLAALVEDFRRHGP